MMHQIIRKQLVRGTVIVLFLLAGWISFYSFRSSHGSYHEIVREGGITQAVWFPLDFESRHLAPERPPGGIGSGHYARQRRLPDHYPLDWPLLAIDRWIFHKTVQTVSGQGDMPRLYELSQDGKTLTPTAHQN